MVSKMSSALLLALLPSVIAAVTVEDMHRAVEQTPRPQFKGPTGLAHANAVLNRHLAGRPGLKTSPCEEFSAEQLQSVALALFPEANPALLEVYHEATDNRRRLFASEQAMEAEFGRLNKLVAAERGLHGVLRDGLCHQVVMSFVHHLTSAAQLKMARLGLELPLLPVSDHSSERPEGPAAEEVHRSYTKSITCQKCHVGGIDCLTNAAGCVHEKRPATAKQLARRCYTNYKELFNVTCGPCDGIAGKYWGDDDDKYFSADPCAVVGTPEQVPEAERVPAAFPIQFSVDVVAGSDRWGRTTNPTAAAKTPFPPLIDSMYGQISGKWFVDITPQSDLWLLRHDTKYAHVAFNGSFIPLLSFHVSEIHSQTAAQQKANVTGPMVSLIDGIPNFVPGGCTCVADPVGVPDVHYSRTTGLDQMEYLGRINLTLAEHDGSVVTVDHWANWFFHVFMELDTTLPHYGKAPKRLASAYAGTAVYANWNLTDPVQADPTVWTRGIPLSPERVGPDHGKYCMNPTKISMCNNISRSTFPPAPEPAVLSEDTPWHVIHRSFMPGMAKVEQTLAERIQRL